MHEVFAGLLWTGHAMDIREPETLFGAGIEAVVDVAYEESPAVLPRNFIYCRFPLNDGGGNNSTLMVQAVQTVVDLLATGTRTIVACSAGMSRSPSIAAFALASHLSKAPEEIVARIAETGSLEINPALWSHLTQVHSQVKNRGIDPPTS